MDISTKEQKEYIQKNKKIDGHKFNKVSDITNMIDLLNNEREKEMEELSSLVQPYKEFFFICYPIKFGKPMGK